MILHIKETALKVKKKHCDVSSRMYYLKFTLKVQNIPDRNMLKFIFG